MFNYVDDVDLSEKYGGGGPPINTYPEEIKNTMVLTCVRRIKR